MSQAVWGKNINNMTVVEFSVLITVVELCGFVVCLFVLLMFNGSLKPGGKHLHVLS